MKILALDPSTRAVGWCHAEDGEYLYSGVWTPPDGEWWERIAYFEEWLDNITYETECLITEIATGNQGNMHTNRLLGAVEYAVRKLAWEIEIPLVTVTASQVRASGCHKEALAVASGIAGEDITDGDRADAIGVWLAGWKKIQEERRGEL